MAEAIGLLVQVGDSLKSRVAERLAKGLSPLRWLQATAHRCEVAGDSLGVLLRDLAHSC